jgi:hypothetical protein
MPAVTRESSSLESWGKGQLLGSEHVAKLYSTNQQTYFGREKNETCTYFQMHWALSKSTHDDYIQPGRIEAKPSS